MKGKLLETLRGQIEDSLKKGLKEKFHDKAPRVTVTTTHTNTLSVVIASPAFKDLDFDQRTAIMWSLLDEQYSESELARVDFWRLFTLTEAKKVFPDWLNPLPPVVSVQ